MVFKKLGTWSAPKVPVMAWRGSFSVALFRRVHCALVRTRYADGFAWPRMWAGRTHFEDGGGRWRFANAKMTMPFNGRPPHAVNSRPAPLERSTTFWFRQANPPVPCRRRAETRRRAAKKKPPRSLEATRLPRDNDVTSFSREFQHWQAGATHANSHLSSPSGYRIRY